MRLRDERSGVQIPAYEIFILTKGAQPASYSMGIGGSFSRALSEWGDKLLAPHLMTRLRIRAMLLLPLQDFMASTKTPPHFFTSFTMNTNKHV
jgi:hypothetical protein